MATTYTRINYILRLVAKRGTWDSRAEVADEILRMRPPEMLTHGDGSADEHYMSRPSIERLLGLMSDLEIIVVERDGTVAASDAGLRSLDDSVVFDLLVQSSVRSLLEQGGAPIEKIFATISTVRLPAVPDAKTIYNRLRPKTRTSKTVRQTASLLTITGDQFRRLLYLYACAGGIYRDIRILYHPATGEQR